MDYIQAVTLAILPAIAIIFLGYFIISHFIKPQSVGSLIRILWTIAICWVVFYLIVLTPVSINRYFGTPDSLGFWISIAVGFIVGLILWLTILSRNKSK